MCGGFIPGGIGCWKEKTPARWRYNLTTERGLILNQNNSRIAQNVVITTRRLYDARAVCHDFWDDLAAPILAGIITAAIVGGGVTGSKVKTGVRLP